MESPGGTRKRQDKPSKKKRTKKTRIEILRQPVSRYYIHLRREDGKAGETWERNVSVWTLYGDQGNSKKKKELGEGGVEGEGWS